MFPRNLEIELKKWRKRSHRKPLILRGARQIGKTTLIRQFGHSFQTFIELNLEKTKYQQIFKKVMDVDELIQSIEGVTGQRIIPTKTLLFLDEIQNSAVAVQMLRYLYEELPDLHVIGTSSLLEVRMKQEGWSYPVGRVEFLYLHPLTFDEFLQALGEEVLLEQLTTVSIKKNFPQVLHEKSKTLLAEYLVVGGMPAAVKTYCETKSFLDVRREHETLALSFEEDFPKYAKAGEVALLRLLWNALPYELGQRVTHTRLVQHEYTSLKVSQALNVLFDGMLVKKIEPSVHTTLPLLPKKKVAPKYLPVDIGLSLSMRGISLEQIKNFVLDPARCGGLWEAYVGQELLASNVFQRQNLYFWFRETKGASAELDYLFTYEDQLVPIEVKSGSQGSLKSLHQFLIRSPCQHAVRVYDGPLAFQSYTVKTPTGTSLSYQLLSIPLYLAFRIKELASFFLY